MQALLGTSQNRHEWVVTRLIEMFKPGPFRGHQRKHPPIVDAPTFLKRLLENQRIPDSKHDEPIQRTDGRTVDRR